jgi:hypothetical protein
MGKSEPHEQLTKLGSYVFDFHLYMILNVTAVNAKIKVGKSARRK